MKGWQVPSVMASLPLAVGCASSLDLISLVVVVAVALTVVHLLCFDCYLAVWRLVCLKNWSRSSSVQETAVPNQFLAFLSLNDIDERGLSMWLYCICPTSAFSGSDLAHWTPPECLASGRLWHCSVSWWPLLYIASSCFSASFMLRCHSGASELGACLGLGVHIVFVRVTAHPSLMGCYDTAEVFCRVFPHLSFFQPKLFILFSLWIWQQTLLYHCSVHNTGKMHAV